jgi:hypothetical protein
MKTDQEILENMKAEYEKLPESEKREIQLMGVMKDALENALEVNGSVVLNLDEAVRLHVKSIAYYMGMSRHFDDLNARATFLASMAKDLMLLVSDSRECFKNYPLPGRMQIIEDESDMSRPN